MVAIAKSRQTTRVSVYSMSWDGNVQSHVRTEWNIKPICRFVKTKLSVWIPFLLITSKLWPESRGTLEEASKHVYISTVRYKCATLTFSNGEWCSLCCCNPKADLFCSNQNIHQMDLYFCLLLEFHSWRPICCSLWIVSSSYSLHGMKL